ncbi:MULTISPECIES: S-layer homology domain-containing protein [unclassified Moorena]|uniref:S-layer homology domain-containing protein n=1 Tax=unclassified Moorena TaxID=2683338 RepID=UPI0013BFF74B|nr:MULTISPECIES: S-layer homology domain-containing protein [unclassified Moorena]NEO09371.1 S-layer homology domain-containing protein [Moorena sp. SIO3I8]NEO22187.1 S-layer homology domain-containing protein [Moorena sp. SIO4A5]NEQ57617.1 S-layer homology domain-containing protein [Moorena sp. SIO4A1]
MTNQSPSERTSPPTAPQPSRKPILDLDELLAIIVAFATIGLILFWGTRGNRGKFSFKSLESPFASSESTESTGELSLFPSLKSITGGGNSSFARSSSSKSRTSSWFRGYSVDPATGLMLGSAQGNSPEESETSPFLGLFSSGYSSTGYRDRTMAKGKAGSDGNTDGSTGPDQARSDGNTDGSTGPDQARSDGNTDGSTGPDQAQSSSQTIPIDVSDFRSIQPAEIPKNHWASPFMRPLAKDKVLINLPDQEFLPDRQVTRGELAAQIQKAFQEQKKRQRVNYKDKPTDQSASKAIDEATETGFMSGYPGQEFRPEQKVPRVQVLVSLISGLDLQPSSNPAETLKIYRDQDDIPEWAIEKVAAATEAGIVVNYSEKTMLRPNQPATHAEMVSMLYQALVTSGKAQGVSSPYIVAPK